MGLLLQKENRDESLFSINFVIPINLTFFNFEVGDKKFIVSRSLRNQRKPMTNRIIQTFKTLASQNLPQASVNTKAY